MSARAGGPAFPMGATIPNEHGVLKWEQTEGMTLRDYFAAAALQGCCANSYASGNAKPISEATAAELATMSFDIADAMLKERAK